MKTRRRFPEAGALARARALLLEAGLQPPIDDWSSLATICDTAWLPATRRPTPAAARMLRRRLQPLSAAPVTVAAARSMSRGEVVHVRGAAHAIPGRRHELLLWRTRTVRADDGVWLVEEANDFALVDASGDRIVVLAEGGHLINGDVLRDGETVSVFGLLDDVPDRAGLSALGHGRRGVLPALRSGERHPLLLSLIGSYDRDDVVRK